MSGVTRVGGQGRELLAPLRFTASPRQAEEGVLDIRGAYARQQQSPDFEARPAAIAIGRSAEASQRVRATETGPGRSDEAKQVPSPTCVGNKEGRQEGKTEARQKEKTGRK